MSEKRVNCENIVQPLDERGMRPCGKASKGFHNGKWRCEDHLREARKRQRLADLPEAKARVVKLIQDGVADCGQVGRPELTTLEKALVQVAIKSVEGAR